MFFDVDEQVIRNHARYAKQVMKGDSACICSFFFCNIMFYFFPVFAVGIEFPFKGSCMREAVNIV